MQAFIFVLSSGVTATNRSAPPAPAFFRLLIRVGEPIMAFRSNSDSSLPKRSSLSSSNTTS